jgi:hypothetical protein
MAINKMTSLVIIFIMAYLTDLASDFNACTFASTTIIIMGGQKLPYGTACGWL